MSNALTSGFVDVALRGDPPTECFVWHPLSELRVHPGYGFALACHVDSLGRRYFRPGIGAREFAMVVAEGGRAILWRRFDGSPERVFSDGVMSLVFQWAPRLRENLQRRFRRREDLTLSKSARVEVDRADILPESLDPAGGLRWSVRDWMRIGREAAVESGIEKPNEEACIRFGLIEAARLSPVDSARLTADEASSLLRLALFDFGPAESANCTDRENIVGRLSDTLRRHSECGTRQFNRWFFENYDNLVHGIAKRSRDGGQIPREVVRQAFLELVFESYLHIGLAVHAQMSQFAADLPMSLTADERAIFGAMYHRRQELGNLPLLLLCDALSPIPELARELWENPTDQRVLGIVLRALQIHADMVRTKRESERNYKRRRKSPPRRTTPNNSRQSQSPRLCVQRIAADWMSSNNIACRCGRGGRFRTAVDDDLSDGLVTIEVTCEACDGMTTINVPVEFAFGYIVQDEELT